MIRKLLFPAITLLTLVAVSCGPKQPKVTSEPAPADKSAAEASPAPVQKEATPAAEASKATSQSEAKAPESDVAMPEFPPPVDLNGFGSDEPVERPDLPTRGVITFGPDDVERASMAHWEQHTVSNFKAKRWGKYQVRLTYVLNRPALGMQFRLGDLVVKKNLLSAPAPRMVFLGEVYIPQPGDLPFALLTPPTEGSGFAVREVALIPAPEGELPVQAEDGTIVLPAKSATTWSDTMRYEPKAEKDCLGFWTDPDDFAEWEFEVNKPGRYKVVVTQGCGGDNHGSEVEVKQAGQALKFVTEDTGGFQNWKDIAVGEIEIKAAGRQRLAIDPVTKVKSAVLDVQKVVLVPVG